MIKSQNGNLALRDHIFFFLYKFGNVFSWIFGLLVTFIRVSPNYTDSIKHFCKFSNTSFLKMPWWVDFFLNLNIILLERWESLIFCLLDSSYAWSQGLLGLPRGSRGPKPWAVLCCFLRVLARIWIRSGAGKIWMNTPVGCWHYRLRINLLHPRTGSGDQLRFGGSLLCLFPPCCRPLPHY